MIEELNRRKALVYVHPLFGDCCTEPIEWVPDALIEYPNDTSRAIAQPDVRRHAGALPRYPLHLLPRRRNDSVPLRPHQHSGSNRPFLGRVPKGIDYELRKLHYGRARPFEPALAALLAYIPESQILLGSDYPFSSVALSIKGLEEHGLPKDDARRAL